MRKDMFSIEKNYLYYRGVRIGTIVNGRVKITHTDIQVSKSIKTELEQSLVVAV